MPGIKQQPGGRSSVSSYPTAGEQPVNVPNQASGVQISVSDSGIGIDADDLKRIFNPFEQVENSTSRKYQGTGLGLSLSKSLVEFHGGK